MRTILITSAAYLILVIALISCKKESENKYMYYCNKGDAINYGREGECVFLSDVFAGAYETKIVSTDYAKLSIDKTYTIAFSKTTYFSCNFAGQADYNIMHMGNRGGTDFFSYDGGCMYLKGYHFYLSSAEIQDSNDWTMRSSMQGEGTFTDGGFEFKGTIYPKYSSTTYNVQLKGTKK
jgi:hypothetical protein